MRRFLAAIFLLSWPIAAFAQAPSVSRRDGFLMLWQSMRRPALTVREKPFSDVPEGSVGFTEITYAKARGILDDADSAFHPDARLSLPDALTWLFRTRNVAEAQTIQPATLSGFLARYPIANVSSQESASKTLLTSDDLVTLMRSLDTALAEEVHEVSLYGEKFHGKGTAFGETFDMNALTAAHRTYPSNTLVRVTNIENGKSVVVRINDRGPYVTGRDMDLSVAAFTAIADRRLGKIHARFDRLGDASLVRGCGEDAVYQVRLTRLVRLERGVPHTLALGKTLELRANKAFVVRGIGYPDGTFTVQQDWILTDEHFAITPSIPGDYLFRLATLDGHQRDLTMRVVDCAHGEAQGG